jgi:uncharacterized membrane protein SpoIIM required for sporulation
LSTVEEFVAARQRSWTRLEELLARARGDVRRLEAEELEELGALYRRLSSDLAIAQRDYPGDRVLQYLNQFFARAHAQVYRAPAGVWRRLARFFLVEFPQVYRANFGVMLAAALLFVGPAAIAFAGVQLSEELQRTLVPPGLAELIRRGRMWTDISEGLRPIASSFIMTNNIQVAFLAFAGGVLLGLGSAYVLSMNGLLLGAVAGMCQQYGLSLPLWSFVAPHGAIELSVIVVSGGAGLILGWALLNPGLRGRAEALSQAASQASRLLVGCVPLLVVAGTIEGFVSPSSLIPEIKIAIGVVTGVALHAFLLASGRRLDTAADGGARPFRQRGPHWLAVLTPAPRRR